jgi:hypothetical protein
MKYKQFWIGSVPDDLLTTASLGKLGQTKDSVITGNRLEGNITMPFPPSSLLALVAIGEELLSLLRADDADFVILNAVLTT